MARCRSIYIRGIELNTGEKKGYPPIEIEIDDRTFTIRSEKEVKPPMTPSTAESFSQMQDVGLGDIDCDFTNVSRLGQG